ncbi:MAG: amidohydrolase family protein, partial [Acidobacteriota bacterium]|nr:amidohydrolase family protein [Acidobacteriota bacterium]
MTLATALTVACAAERVADPPPPELILTDGAIYTVDASRRWVDALAIRDGRIVAAGGAGEVAALAGPGTRTVDLGGRFVMPAFHDAHVHPLSAGVELGQCNLNDLDRADDVLAAVRRCADTARARAWIVGGGWDLTSFPPGQPDKTMLDAVTAERPTALSSADGHTLWANSAALAAAGVTRATSDPAAGRIERDAQGEPTGVLREAATDLVSRVIPPVTAAEREAGLVRAAEVLNRFGIVSVQEASARDDAVEAYRAVAGRGKLNVRAR